MQPPGAGLETRRRTDWCRDDVRWITITFLDGKWWLSIMPILGLELPTFQLRGQSANHLATSDHGIHTHTRTHRDYCLCPKYNWMTGAHFLSSTSLPVHSCSCMHFARYQNGGHLLGLPGSRLKQNVSLVTPAHVDVVSSHMESWLSHTYLSMQHLRHAGYDRVGD